MPNPLVTIRSSSFSLYCCAVLVLALLSGCGGGGGGSSASSFPGGLYSLGTGTLDGTSVSDIIAFTHDNRIIAFSETAEVLIDGNLGSIEGDSYRVQADIYKNGILSQSDVRITGTVIADSSINGTLHGSGTGDGDFTITFNLDYNRAATFARMEATGLNLWEGAATTVSTFTFIDSTNDENFEGGATGGGTTCEYTGTKSIPIADKNIYQLVLDADDFGDTCDHHSTTDFTGFFAVVDGTATDDTLWFAAANGVNANFSVMMKR